MFIKIQQIRFATNYLAGTSEWINVGNPEFINVDRIVSFSVYPEFIGPNTFHLQLTVGHMICQSDDLAKMSEKASEKPLCDTTPKQPASIIEEFVSQMMMLYQIHVTEIDFSETNDLYKIMSKVPPVPNPTKGYEHMVYRAYTPAGPVMLGVKEAK